jgi:hypothetical protein
MSGVSNSRLDLDCLQGLFAISTPHRRRIWTLAAGITRRGGTSRRQHFGTICWHNQKIRLMTIRQALSLFDVRAPGWSYPVDAFSTAGPRQSY